MSNVDSLKLKKMKVPQVNVLVWIQRNYKILAIYDTLSSILMNISGDVVSVRINQSVLTDIILKSIEPNCGISKGNYRLIHRLLAY